ncbi:DUF2281 domain-containing protein [Limnoraphis robusta Tam1]|uniref:DUF2281 domain-containing protein n=1 Tax=Limnoraphis robusta CCNP1315 TaxID=3110306 RepID=A0ABU5TR49_9CYAN|nr:DUF2281 domain-containing protein [Limnoraphis robusta]MEA5497566.1 DUF2281 domain-containing protein [Limnoraphis robusta BA-68 BA1]MEA5517349.1 DUF2281 domain-containing protein [Limnoraphis robusta CCNP1315]MEA5542971.1 DUF2281 domain-containing protein [Limnoraphis robusta Tam1]MEA5546062.1 DUF2281 domain-containing protein [Limnoraphis robusta CCNP1324]
MSLTNTILKKITQILESFSPDKQQEVLNYVEFLQSKSIFEQSKLSWDEFIQRTDGSCADDPIVLDEEGISEESPR